MRQKNTLTKKNVVLSFLLLFIFFSFYNANAQCTNGDETLIDWAHQNAGTPGQMQYQPYVPGGGTYDETGTFTTTTCGEQTTMTLNFIRNTSNTNGIAGLDYTMQQQSNGNSTFRLTFSSPVIISNLQVGDIDRKSSYVDRLVFSAQNSGTNVPVNLSGNLVTINGQTVTPTTNTQDEGTVTATTSSAVTEISFTFNNGNNQSGQQFVLIKAGFEFCCPISCLAGTTAPVLSATTLQNTCPSSVASLNSLVTSSIPAGTVLEWHTSATPSRATRYNNVATASAGTYYAVFYDTANDCYSPVTSPVTVTIDSCNEITVCNPLINPNCDGDTVNNDVDLDDDNDGITDVDEAFVCGLNNADFKAERTEYDFTTAVLGEYSNVTAGNTNAQTIGTYTVNSPIGNVFSVGKIVDEPGPLGTNSNLMEARVVKDFSNSAERTDIHVYNFAHRDNLKFNNNQINRKFVIEYDFLMESDVYDEYATYISNGENGTVYTNTSNNYDAYATYRMQLWSHTNGARNIQGTAYRFSTSGSVASWYRLVTTYQISAALNSLEITNTLYKYNSGTLSTTPVNTTSYTVAVNTSGAQSWLVNGFQAGVLSDNKYDNVEMYWLVCDTDGDKIPDYLDSDSDDDGCPDAIEGDGGVLLNQLDANYQISGGTDVNGIPSLVNGGQSDVSVTNPSQQATECDPCNSASSSFVDSDSDGIGDACDLDDDNDGILDTDEDAICDLNVVNGGMNGTEQMNQLPNGWSRVPFTDAHSEATAANYTTSDTWGPTGPIPQFGAVGNPAEGATFIATMYGRPGTNINDRTQDGIRQTISGFTPGENYTINFMQTVAKYSAYRGSKGYYKVYIDGNFVGQSTPTTSNLNYDDVNLIWESKSVTFTASAASHQIDFMPFSDQFIPSEGRDTSVYLGIDDMSITKAVCDTDNDGVPNSLDLDSDGDGCPDALEANPSLTFSNLNPNNTINATVGALSGSNPGVPNSTPAADAGTSQDNTQQAIECDSCNSNSTLFSDADLDGIGDVCDLDDDNDGILDTIENACSVELVTNGSFEQDTFQAPEYSTVYTIGAFIGSNIPVGTINNNDVVTGWSYTTNVDGWIGTRTLIADAKEGDKYIDVVGATINGNANVLTQNITTEVGKTYTYSFYWGEDFGHNAGETVNLTTRVLNGATVLVNQNLTATAQGEVGGVRGPKTWYFFSTTFTATSVTTTLEFTAVTPSPELNAGAALDLVSVKEICDVDGDGVPNSLDLDSDGDGCPDALEANSSLTFSSLNPDNTINATVGTLSESNPGVPNNTPAANAGTSQDDTQQAAECDPCNTASSLFSDADLDGIGDECDLDDDNDGILDTDEMGKINWTDNFWSDPLTNSYTSNGYEVTFSLDRGANDNITSITNSDIFDGAVPDPRTLFWSKDSRDSINSNEPFLTIDFTKPVTNLKFTVIDVDQFATSTWHDQIEVTATSPSGTSVPVILKAQYPDRVNVFGNKANSISTVTELNNTPFGNVFVTIPGEVSSVTIKYQNGPTTRLNPPAQGIGLAQLCFDIDTDNDGVPNRLDLDSDEDGCPDSLEANASLDYSNLNLDGSINATVGTLAESNPGVPNNSPASGIGTSQNANQQADECNPCTSGSSLFTDADGDGIGDVCDLDDDNDGILDTDEVDCSGTGLTWSEHYTSGTGGSEFTGPAIVSESPITLPGTTVTYLPEVTGALSGTRFAVNSWKAGFAPHATFLQQSINNVDANFSEHTFTFNDPVFNLSFTILDLDIDPRVEELTITVTDSNDNLYFLRPEDYVVDGHRVSTNVFTSTPTSTNKNIVINPLPIAVKSIKFKFTSDQANITSPASSPTAFGISNMSFCTLLNSDTDGVPDYLDTDSDNDGCPDALEGAGSFTTADLVNFGVEGAAGVDNSLGDQVNDNGIPVPPGVAGNGLTGQGTTPAVIDDAISNACGADLSLAKIVDSALPKVGEDIVYTLTLKNSGSFDATGVQVTDVLPAAVTYKSSTASQGAYNESTDIWDLTSVTINNGQEVTLSITATVNTSGVITNTAEIRQVNQNDTDSEPNNNK